MNSWLLILTATTILGLLLFRLNLYIAVYFHRHSSDDYITVTVYALQKLIVYSIKIPVVKLFQEDNSLWITSKIIVPPESKRTRIQREQRFIKKMAKLLVHNPEQFLHLLKTSRRFIRGYRSFVQALTKKIHCQKFELAITCGSDDAAIAGLMTGILRAITAILLITLHKRLTMTAKPVIRIQPNYHQPLLNMELTCIFSVRLGNVITAAMAILATTLHREATRSV